jgi:hypothetical protein
MKGHISELIKEIATSSFKFDQPREVTAAADQQKPKCPHLLDEVQFEPDPSFKSHSPADRQQTGPATPEDWSALPHKSRRGELAYQQSDTQLVSET